MEFSMAGAVAVTVEGLMIVFGVLVIIMLVLFAMKLFAKEEAPVGNGASTKAPAAAKDIPKSFVISDIDVDAMEENERIAVFSAAIAAYMDTPISGISIESYKKISE